ncbi:MAG: hypothetical protein H7Z37_04850 [Pyrinomonadaceae bacterium]|nr:hypothetical protein [Pyrinomonadaceae bacterium]
MSQLIEGEDFYWENGFLVMTAKYHLNRGHCCKSGCRHCPYRKNAESEKKFNKDNNPHIVNIDEKST